MFVVHTESGKQKRFWTKRDALIWMTQGSRNVSYKLYRKGFLTKKYVGVYLYSIDEGWKCYT